MQQITNPFTGFKLIITNTFAFNFKEIGEYKPISIGKTIYWIMDADTNHDMTGVVHYAMTNWFHAMNLKILSLELKPQETASLFSKIEQFIKEQGPDMQFAVEAAFGK